MFLGGPGKFPARGPPLVPGGSTTQDKRGLFSLIPAKSYVCFCFFWCRRRPLLPPPREPNVPEHRRRRRRRPEPCRASPTSPSAVVPASAATVDAAPASTPRARSRLRRPRRPPLHAAAPPPSPLRATAPPAPRLVVQGRAAPLGFPAALCE